MSEPINAGITVERVDNPIYPFVLRSPNGEHNMSVVEDYLTARGIPVPAPDPIEVGDKVRLGAVEYEVVGAYGVWLWLPHENDDTAPYVVLARNVERVAS